MHNRALNLCVEFRNAPSSINLWDENCHAAAPMLK
jgi:hypothetical protein